jgi:hypothetical protein
LHDLCLITQISIARNINQMAEDLLTISDDVDAILFLLDNLVISKID